MHRLLPYLSGSIAIGLAGFSITSILILTRHALAAAGPLV